MAGVDKNGNYYSIRKVPTGRGGVTWPTLNYENGAEWLKNYAPIKNFRVKNFALKGAYLDGYWSYTFGSCAK